MRRTRTRHHLVATTAVVLLAVSLSGAGRASGSTPTEQATGGDSPRAPAGALLTSEEPVPTARGDVVGAATAQPDFWITNGTVRASLLVGSTLYIGGDFTYVGPSLGHAIALDPTTGVAEATFPHIGGTVEAITSDGNGGWFVGGTLARADGHDLGDLVHVLPDGTVDPSFAPRPGPSGPGTVAALAFADGVLYVGGEFTSIGGVSRTALAALDPATGTVEPWSPVLGFNSNFGPPEVDALAVADGVVYVGGRFVTADGVSAVALGGFDAGTARLVWNPATGWPGGTLVSALALSGDTVYAGVGVSGPQGQSIVHAFRIADATLRWQTPAWAGSIALAGGRVYAAGNLRVFIGFDDDGNPVFRNQSLYALDPASGSPLGWDPQADGAHALTALDGTLYAGGFFGNVADTTRQHLAAFDGATGALLGWNPNASGEVGTLASDGGTVVAGGALNSVGGVNYDYFAAIDTTTGQATSLDLGLDGSVTAIANGGQTLFIGGGFAHVQGQFRDRIAEINPATGDPTSWQAQAEFPGGGLPDALAPDGSTVYVGGGFTDLRTSRGLVSRGGLAAFSRRTGRLTNWNPSANGPVRALALNGGLIYAAGSFQHIGFTPRNGIAAITAAGGATDWDADINLTGRVGAFQIVGDTVYLGGDFDTVGGQPRVDLAAVSRSSGAVQPWAPNTTAPFGSVGALAVHGNTVYVGGDFLQLQGRVGLAAFTADTGSLTPFQADTNAGGDVRTLVAARTGTLYAGGSFTDIAASGHENLAAITP